jgi:Ca2+-binding EF-hand superfamily protein
MSIQRRHRLKLYKEGGKRIMSRAEFGVTINHTLEFIQMVASEELLDEWFAIIDLDHDGWISYEVYFQFLRYYFGGASIAALETINVLPQGKVGKGEGMNADQKFMYDLKDLNPF